MLDHQLMVIRLAALLYSRMLWLFRSMKVFIYAIDFFKSINYTKDISVFENSLEINTTEAFMNIFCSLAQFLFDLDFFCPWFSATKKLLSGPLSIAPGQHIFYKLLTVCRNIKFICEFENFLSQSNPDVTQRNGRRHLSFFIKTTQIPCLTSYELKFHSNLLYKRILRLPCGKMVS